MAVMGLAAWPGRVGRSKAPSAMLLAALFKGLEQETVPRQGTAPLIELEVQPVELGTGLVTGRVEGRPGCRRDKRVMVDTVVAVVKTTLVVRGHEGAGTRGRRGLDASDPAWPCRCCSAWARPVRAVPDIGTNKRRAGVAIAGRCPAACWVVEHLGADGQGHATQQVLRASSRSLFWNSQHAAELRRRPGCSRPAAWGERRRRRWPSLELDLTDRENWSLPSGWTTSCASTVRAQHQSLAAADEDADGCRRRRGMLVVWMYWFRFADQAGRAGPAGRSGSGRCRPVHAMMSWLMPWPICLGQVG